MKRSNKNPVSFGPERASGWNCTVKAVQCRIFHALAGAVVGVSNV
jgi:hypothetical protein